LSGSLAFSRLRSYRVKASGCALSQCTPASFEQSSSNEILNTLPEPYPDEVSMNAHLEPKRLISYFFILAIGLVFILQFGPGSRGCEQPLTAQKTAAAAVVNGKEIPLRDFVAAYSNQLQYFRIQGSNIPSSLARQIGIPQQVLDQLVTAELLAQAADKRGIVPSDAELQEALTKNPDFQKDGAFSLERYGLVLREYYRKSTAEYEAEARRRLAAQKLLELVTNGAVVSEEEVRTKYFREGNKANITFVRFLPTMYAGAVPAPKPQEVASFQKEHAKEIADYYQANRFLYRQPERVRARHILIKVEKDAPEEQKAQARQRIEQIRKEISGGKDFAEAAKEYSEDPGTQSSGGDLGFNERSSWVPEFANAAFSLQPGQISQPVETQFGIHLIKVEEKKPAEEKELKDVEPEIARQLYTKDKAKQLARSAAEKALATAQKSGKTLAQLYPPDKDKDGKTPRSRFETESKPTSAETGPFSISGDTVGQLGSAPELAGDIAASDAAKMLGKVYSVGEGFALAQVTERTRPSDAQYAEQKDKLTADAIQAKRAELRESYFKALKKGAQIRQNEDLIAQVANSS
jgi:peptidyl-prolyl cis-trans isomerase D